MFINRIFIYAYQSGIYINAVNRKYETIKLSEDPVRKIIRGEIKNHDELEKAKLSAFEVLRYLICVPELTANMDERQVEYAHHVLVQCIHGNRNNPYELQKLLGDKISHDVPIEVQMMYHQMKNVIQNLPKLNVCLRQAKKNVIKLISFEAYAESSTQAILQTYTLWKRPIHCLHLDTSNGNINIIHCNIL